MGSSSMSMDNSGLKENNSKKPYIIYSDSESTML